MRRAVFVEVNSPAMAASSFSHEQIRHFREAFSQYSDPESGGVTSQRFSDAILACLEHCSLSATPPPDYLNSEFNRLGTTGALTWQKFFQVSWTEVIRFTFFCVENYEIVLQGKTLRLDGCENCLPQ